MSYSRTTWIPEETPLSADNFNNIEDGIEESLNRLDAIASNTELFNAIYPIGSIYMSTSSTNPAAYFGGTWVAWGQGRVPVGVGTSDKVFAANESGGASKVTLTAAQSGVPAHSHGVGSIVAKMANHVHSMAHTHNMGLHRHAMPHSHGASGITVTTPSLQSSYDDFIHSPNAVSSYQGTINSSSSANYRYLRISETGSGRSLGRSAASISSGRSCTVGGSTAQYSGYTDYADGTTSGSSADNTGNPTALNNCTMSGSTANNTAANATEAHNNLQPYITCYMWKRTA